MITPQKQKTFLVGFSMLPGIGPGMFKKIKKYFPDLETAWRAASTDYLKAGIPEKLAASIIENRQKINPDEEFEKVFQTGITVIDQEDENYPTRLKEISSAPFLLYCQGNLPLLNKKQLAVVGSRKPTDYGVSVIEKLLPEIIQAGLIITSGMAQGVDSLAHREALKLESPTVAVLGGGIKHMASNGYNRKFMEEILDQNGLILSEYSPDFPSGKITFPARNRIISGLSVGVLIIEAGEKSGTLITAKHALDQNREIFSVPGNIFSANSVGTHWLIKQGAQLVSSVNDILQTLNFVASSSSENDSGAKERMIFENETEEKVYANLSLDPVHIDNLAKTCKLASSEISTALSIMELKGMAKNVGGGRFVRN